ncbi:MAG: hypothetical protein IIZ49_00495, partial [Oscillospiraceae bacterium]|nr:hypothetical protein [Oscillospiraceae bacterium]
CHLPQRGRLGNALSKDEMKPAYFARVVVGPIIDQPRHSAPNCISGDHRRAGKKQNQNSKIVLTGNKKILRPAASE